MALAISVSMAEKSGAFLGGGFQYSIQKTKTPSAPQALTITPR